MSLAPLPTTLIEAPRLSRKLGVNLIIASETFQYTGSFKFRASGWLVSQVPNPLVITASSGNFGQALAFACSLRGKSSLVVMPQTSARVKIDAVREFGGNVDLVDVRQQSREERVKELACRYPEAYIASAYDDRLVIEGNSSLGREIADWDRKIHYILAPVGGGGLCSGIILGLRQKGASIPVLGAEPLMANDAARSLRAGFLIRNDWEPRTIADGARTISLGVNNWQVLKDGLAGIIEVPEENILEGVRMLYSFANLKVEPTGALSVAAILSEPERFQGASVCCVVSGGNVDAAVYRAILESC